jgi:hypothetical protein
MSGKSKMSIRRKIYISSFSLKGAHGVRIPALGLPKDLLDSKFIIQGCAMRAVELVRKTHPTSAPVLYLT